MCEISDAAVSLRGFYSKKGKGKAIPVQPWTGPEGARNLRLPQSANEGGKVVSPTHRPPLPPPGNIPGTHYFKG